MSIPSPVNSPISSPTHTRYLPVPYGAVWPPSSTPDPSAFPAQPAPSPTLTPKDYSPPPWTMAVPLKKSALPPDDFDWDIPDFATFAEECSPGVCTKYPLLPTVEINKSFPLYALTARVLEQTYGVNHPGDRRRLVIHILKRLFTVELFTRDNYKNMEHIFWNENEERLSHDWGLSYAELDNVIEDVEGFKLLYFFQINNMEELSPFMRRAVTSAIGDNDPRQRLKDNQLNSNGMVGVLAGLILAAILPLATNKDVGIFATDFSQTAIVASSICTCFTFLIIVYSADNVIRLYECPTDKALLFVCSAFERRTIADRRFWGWQMPSYILNLFCDYLYLLMFSVILVGTALWHWVGVYSQQYADEKYRTYVVSVNQNITEMERFYRIDQKPPARMGNVNAQFMAIAISVMILVGLMIARCAWLKILGGVVAGIDYKEKDPEKQRKKEAKQKLLEEMLKTQPNFGLEKRAKHIRGVAAKKCIFIFAVLIVIWGGVSGWALWNARAWYYDAWKKCCLIPTFSVTPTKRFF